MHIIGIFLNYSFKKTDRLKFRIDSFKKFCLLSYYLVGFLRWLAFLVEIMNYLQFILKLCLNL